jgi:hypothetical protein
MDPEVKRQLDLRLAKGEITREEYSATIKAMMDGDKSAGISPASSSGGFSDWLARLKDPYGEFSYKNVEPTDEAPLIVNDELSLFGSTLKFRQITLRYSDIRSLSFDGLRKTINKSLSTYHARLGILPPSGEWIKILGEWKSTAFEDVKRAFGRQQSVIKVKLVENAYFFLAPITFKQRMQNRLDEMVRNGYTNICQTKGKPEVRLFRDGFIEKEGLRISLSQAHSEKLIKLGSSGFLHTSPGEFIFGQKGTGFFARNITVDVWIDRDVIASIIIHFAEGRLKL